VSGRVTLGVAIAIPEPHASVLSEWRRGSGDAAADLMWPHVTLLPPTPVAVDEIAAIEEHLAHAARTVEPFEMHLSGTGTFRPISPVVFVQVARGVSNCEVLEANVRSGPLQRELEFPYHPHVTVAQLVAEPELDRVYEGLAGFAARFEVSGFHLFHREADGHWRTRSEFLLGARG
jgi:2'-5' RNA ligase